MRFRLYPSPAQEEALLGHCAQARFVWNLALEQANCYRPQWGPTPGYVAQSAQLTEARAASNVRAKAGLNREILTRRWGLFARRLQDKATLAGVAVVKVPAAYTSQRCSVCGTVAAKSPESQATFRCITCGHSEHADINAARNILAAGRAVTARGGEQPTPSNREPQPRSLQAA